MLAWVFVLRLAMRACRYEHAHRHMTCHTPTARCRSTGLTHTHTHIMHAPCADAWTHPRMHALPPAPSYLAPLQEDDKLRELVAKHGAQNWSVIAKALPGRNGKSCRCGGTTHTQPHGLRCCLAARTHLALDG